MTSHRKSFITIELEVYYSNHSRYLLDWQNVETIIFAVNWVKLLYAFVKGISFGCAQLT